MCVGEDARVGGLVPAPALAVTEGLAPAAAAPPDEADECVGDADRVEGFVAVVDEETAGFFATVLLLPLLDVVEPCPPPLPPPPAAAVDAGTASESLLVERSMGVAAGGTIVRGAREGLAAGEPTSRASEEFAAIALSFPHAAQPANEQVGREGGEKSKNGHNPAAGPQNRSDVGKNESHLCWMTTRTGGLLTALIAAAGTAAVAIASYASERLFASTSRQLASKKKKHARQQRPGKPDPRASQIVAELLSEWRRGCGIAKQQQVCDNEAWPGF